MSDMWEEPLLFRVVIENSNVCLHRIKKIHKEQGHMNLL